MWAGVPRMSPRNPKCSEAKNFHPSALCSGKSRRDYPGRLGTCSCPHANLTRAHSMRTILSFRYIGSSPSCSESAISNAKIPFRGPELERGRHLQIRRIARLLDAIYLLSRSSPGNRAPPDFCHRVKLSASNSSLISTIGDRTLALDQGKGDCLPLKNSRTGGLGRTTSFGCIGQWTRAASGLVRRRTGTAGHAGETLPVGARGIKCIPPFYDSLSIHATRSLDRSEQFPEPFRPQVFFQGSDIDPVLPPKKSVRLFYLLEEPVAQPFSDSSIGPTERLELVAAPQPPSGSVPWSFPRGF